MTPDLQLHQALISFQIPTLSGPTELRKCLQRLPATAQIKAISSIYKRYNNNRMEDLNSSLLCVLHVETTLDAWLLQDALSKISGNWNLLSFGQLVSLTPEMPLPNPTLYEDGALLRCASEAWGSYEHPVLGQSLNELVRSVHSFENIEFFAQGRSVL